MPVNQFLVQYCFKKFVDLVLDHGYNCLHDFYGELEYQRKHYLFNIDFEDFYAEISEDCLLDEAFVYSVVLLNGDMVAVKKLFLDVHTFIMNLDMSQDRDDRESDFIDIFYGARSDPLRECLGNVKDILNPKIDLI